MLQQYFFMIKKKFKVLDQKVGFKKNTYDFLTSKKNTLNMDGKKCF